MTRKLSRRSFAAAVTGSSALLMAGCGSGTVNKATPANTANTAVSNAATTNVITDTAPAAAPVPANSAMNSVTGNAHSNAAHTNNSVAGHSDGVASDTDSQ